MTDQVELRVRAIGLNFRDVLNVMGMWPDRIPKVVMENDRKW